MTFSKKYGGSKHQALAPRPTPTPRTQKIGVVDFDVGEVQSRYSVDGRRREPPVARFLREPARQS
jgi:hypothetical protein